MCRDSPYTVSRAAALASGGSAVTPSRVALEHTIAVGRVYILYIQRMERTGTVGQARCSLQEGRPENLGSREGTGPCGGRCPTPPLPKASGGLKHHTVISSCARHLPWVPEARGPAREVGAGREKAHPTKHRGTAERERSTRRRRSYTRGSEVGDRCRPSLKP